MSSAKIEKGLDNMLACSSRPFSIFRVRSTRVTICFANCDMHRSLPGVVGIYFLIKRIAKNTENTIIIKENPLTKHRLIDILRNAENAQKTRDRVAKGRC